ncbi:glycine-rich domain-containing protein [Kozakia baliensis]|uniref:glycine-rich domain-containing protein n=1 Tax=Kozakia baliensis TaxID=153496 RepID=UPI0004961B9B|nr:hypothetical protein [Kozakia baliensis]
MDRAIVYAGAIPLDTDVLRMGRYAKEGLGRLGEMLYGVKSVSASGLVCSVSSSDLSVSIGTGSILAPGMMDQNAIGALGGGLAADQSAVMCQYFNDIPQRVALPGSGANFTIYAICTESDHDPVVLPFFNAAKPTQTMAGVDNNDASLPTRRSGTMSFVAATTAPPLPTGGAVVALYSVNVPAGAMTLAGIVPAPGSAFFPTIPELATTRLLQQAVAPYAFCHSDMVLGIPAWATRVELRAIGGGGGGASSNALDPAKGSFSGSGGGAGGDAWGVYDIDPAVQGGLAVTIGAGGGSQNSGGTTLVTYNGRTLLQATGGSAGYFYATQGSAGGGGGAATGGTIWNLSGGSGGDGQCAAYVFTGNGGDGPWGGAGRAGSQGGLSGTKFGAGGGGSYSTTEDGAHAAGGAGYQGCVMYRFLP